MKTVHFDHRIKSEHANHLHEYTKHSYALNDILYFGDHATDAQYEMIDNLKTALSQPAKYDFTVYSGLKWAPNELWDERGVDHNHPIILQLPAFTSTSTNLNVAMGFARRFPKPDPSTEVRLDGVSPRAYNGYTDDVLHVLELSVRRGVQLGSVMHVSKHPSEHEIILNAGLEIEMDPIPKVISNDGDFYLIWSAFTRV